MNRQHHLYMHMARILPATLVLASLALAGCTAPAGPDGPFSALAAVGFAHDEAPDAGDLVFISGATLYNPQNPDFVDGLTEAWVYGYRNVATGASKVIEVGSGTSRVTAQDDTTTHLASLPVLDTGGLLDSDDVADIARREGLVPEAPEPGDATIYWLTHEGGRPVWTLELHDSDGTTRTIQIDARSGDVVEAPLQLTYAEAITYAQVAAADWKPGAVLVEAEGVERAIGSFGYFAYEIGSEDGVLSPPDPDAQDGLAPLWGFVYLDEATGTSRSFAVLRDGSVHPGPERTGTQAPGLPKPVHDAQDLVSLDETDHPSLAARYQYRTLAGNPVWILDVRVGDAGEGWVMDAMNGERRDIR